ncbi:5'-3' exoribonuclease 2-like [Watersipora subatra]|uniref:5'-3' exoribonuclease 2-like n=1 Tax=Watersipora subatra TaxID=2589382 RepID=UPI00355C4041
MGVPAFFRWLSRKYPSVVVHAVEEKAKVDEDGRRIQPDCTTPNLNDVEFDNLYLDMNGIIHPCCHPDDKPAPKNEDEMMVAIFEYIDRIFAICRPRKLLYMAIDGVAPRAKMNQQRSRRFRSSNESETKRVELSKIRAQLEANGVTLPPEKPKSEHFDSNCITPGTPFMFRLADCLRYYIHDRLNTDPAWRKLKVILSDANMPGEGEHKIMDYIRKQRGQPDHDPNTQHCLCGADADLIMLGLATHEPNFTIIREEFKPGQPRPCEICAQLGHEAKECTGAPKAKRGEHDELPEIQPSGVEFIFIRLNVLREYLSRDLLLTNINFSYDFERVIDDWIFMCFFVGNDFLPHLPSLEIREGAIDRLVRIYKETARQTGGYLSKDGVADLNKVQVVLKALGEAEDQIFKNRRQDEVRFRARKKNERRQARDQDQWSGAQRPGFMQSQSTAYKPGQGQDQKYTKSGAAAVRTGGSNQNAAASLRAMLYKDGEGNKSSSEPKAGEKRKRNEDSDSDPEPEDDVKLWENGWKERYYVNKFGVDGDDYAFRQKVAKAYAKGLCWVLRYYFQGCASWKWYFPYHYAPFASDFTNLGDLSNTFELGTQPFRPFEQLMSVFPAGSKDHVPPTWRPLMYEPDSPIIDFYPTNFRIDLNGKKWAWMGVALLPFVDEQRLLTALQPRYADLTDEENKRAVKGSDRLFVSKWHDSFDFLTSLYESTDNAPMDLVTRLTDGMFGTIQKDEFVILPEHVVPSPLQQCEDIIDNKAIMVKYEDPKYPEGHIYPAVLLPGAKLPAATLKPEDLQVDNRGNYGGRGRGRGRGRGDSYRPQLGFTPNSGYRTNKDAGPANRMLSSSLRSGGNTIAPPNSYNGHNSYNSGGGRGGAFHQGSGGFQGNRQAGGYQGNINPYAHQNQMQNTRYQPYGGQMGRDGQGSRGGQGSRYGQGSRGGQGSRYGQGSRGGQGQASESRYNQSNVYGQLGHPQQYYTSNNRQYR